MGFFSKELKNEFETAVINEPSVFEPLRVYCICLIYPTERDIYSGKDTNIVYNDPYVFRLTHCCKFCFFAFTVNQTLINVEKIYLSLPRIVE